MKKILPYIVLALGIVVVLLVIWNVVLYRRVLSNEKLNSETWVKTQEHFNELELLIGVE